jgi:tetratricopeptide (TPR) repeat protein/transcriptional regulator with XRE-family HTH domain
VTAQAGFGELLRNLREAAGLTQEELAHTAQLGVTTVSELERGRHLTCHAPTAQRLAGALGLTERARGLFIAAARGRAPAAEALAAAREAVPPGTSLAAGGRDAATEPVPAETGRMAEPGHGRPTLSSLEVRYSLPPDVLAFTGREDELKQIVAAVTHSAGNGGVVAIHAIDGMPGVGKTALALHVAHQLKDRFPDRQLFADLHAHTPGQEPVPAAAALAGLLAATGLDARYLPEGVDARAGLWRDRMAGQRALLVLDNAEGSSQVAPLLPGAKDCLVLVTSRRHLGDLAGPVIPVPVEVLPPAQAQEMFLRLARRASPGSEVAALVRMAGYLPLAISLLARVYARHPSWTLADLTAETRTSLLDLAAENDSVAAAFDLSYRYLGSRRQKFLRRLGLHVGTTIDAYAAAALAGTTVARAAEYLDALHREGLLTEASYRRYGMHDLVRRYAQERAATDSALGRAQARGRLLEFYTRTAEAAGTRLARRPPPSPQPVPATLAAAPDLPDSASALAWTRAERANLLACLDHVGATGQRARVVALTAALAAWLHHDGPWTEAITRHATAVQAARDLGDLPGQARALNDLAVAQRINGDYQESAAALEQALATYRDLGDRLGQAGALNDLGVVHRISGNYPEAAAALEQALAIYQDLGERGGQAAALHDLGALKRMTGNMAGAAAALETALGIYRELGDRLGQAGALNYLGVVCRISGDYQRATAALYEALAIYRDLVDRLGQASALNDLAEVRRITGNYAEAAAALEEALAIYRDLGSRLGQGNALTYLGVVRRITGNYAEAAAALDEALAIYRDLGSRLGQGNALTYLGVMRRITGNYPEAAAALDEALAIYRDLGDAGGETEVLNEAGTLHLARGHPDQARLYHQQALDLATAMSCSWDQAHALAGLGRCALATGDVGESRALLREAQQIFDLIGSAEAKEVAAELDTLGG